MIGEALSAGVVAGLAVALPLGAIGVLILQEGLVRGWRPAFAAATGVALVDFGYAVVAVLAGAGVTAALAGRTRAVQLVGAVVLLLVAVRGLLALRAARPTATGPAPAATTGPEAGPPHRVLGRFVAMTAVNPLTAIYFVVLAAGLGATVAGRRAGAAFVLGVFAGSWAWQLVLAAIGAFTGARLPGWARTATSLTGYLVVIGYAVKLALG